MPLSINLPKVKLTRGKLFLYTQVILLLIVFLFFLTFVVRRKLFDCSVVFISESKYILFLKRELELLNF